MSPFDPCQITATPYLAPLVPTLPIRMRRTEILTVVYRTDPENSAALIPEPLRLASDLCMVHVYWMHDAEWFGVYGESAVQIPVLLPCGSPAVYSPFLVLGSDGAVAAGRELYGQPKKGGMVSLRPASDLLVGRVSRNGIDVITATMCWKQRHADGAELAKLIPGAEVNVNLRIVPTGDGQYRRELLTRELQDFHTHEAWAGPATIELRANAQVPVYQLNVRRVELGLHRLVDFSLSREKVVHVYE